MCTAVSFLAGDHYFGRNLDLERTYNETVTVTPRNCSFHFQNGHVSATHYAMIGMAVVSNGFPLYFEATNEKGLSMAGLNFPENAKYHPVTADKTNVASFELIPWVLGKCQNISEGEKLLSGINLSDVSFSSEYPASPLHWLLSDRDRSLVIESTDCGLQIYHNPVGVLTNNPPLPYHLHNLANYMQLTPHHPINNQPLELVPYSLGMGSFGLPGDMSSGSRFIKAAFTKFHSICDKTEESAVNQFFHILSSVSQQRGLTRLSDGTCEFTLYSCCCNTDKGIYYYTTYDNSRITAVSMHHTDLNGSMPMSFPLIKGCQFLYQN